MSNNRQQAQQAMLKNKARENHERANKNLSKDSTPVNNDFDKEVYVDQEVAHSEKVEDLVKQAQKTDPQLEDTDYAAETDNLPDHIEEKRAEGVASQKVDLDKVLSSVSSSGKIVLETILQYMKDMAPRVPMDMREGARHQARLWNALSTTFNRLDDRDFPIVYRAILDLYDENKDGVFADEMVYRFAEEWPMTETDRAAYRRLTNLILVTREAKTRRKALQQLKNWEYILEFGLSDKARNRIKNFYDL